MNGDALERVHQALSAAGCSIRGNNAQCPAHDDRNPSLSVQHNGTDRVLVWCQGGCQQEDVLRALGLTMADLYDQAREDDKPTSIKRHVVARYDYTDPHGEVLFQKVRYWPKDFRVRHPDRAGGWKYGIGNAQRVLYRWPEVIEAIRTDQPVYVVEGEKSADRLAAEGVVGTTNFDGAARADHTSKWRPAYGDALKGADVTIVVDNDPAGFAHGRAIRDDLTGKAASVRVVRGLVTSKGADLDDHLDAGHTLDELADVDLDEQDEPPAEDDQTGEAPEGDEPPALEFFTFAQLAAKVDAAGPRKWLLRGIWPAGDYGVHAAEPKAQKTWNAADLAVSVASGTDWLGAIPVESPGPVLMFVGEGGEANIVRRIRAVAENRGVVAEQLPIILCTRAPHLANQHHLLLMMEQIRLMQPALVLLDPLYLSVGGANLADLFAMGALLEKPQRICQAIGASLMVVHHFNRKEGRGSSRMMGAGPAEWGRVLISASVKARRTDPDTHATDVVTLLDVIGGEVPDQTLRLHRRIWADDPDNLDSPLHLTVSVTTADTDDEDQEGTPQTRLSPAEQKIVEAFTGADRPLSVKQLIDRIAERHGHGLKRQTASSALNKLEKLNRVTGTEPQQFTERLWSLVDQGEEENPRSARVASCQHDKIHDGLAENPRSARVAGVSDTSALTCQRVSAPIGAGADADTTRDFDAWVRASVTRDPKPVGAISADVATSLGTTPVDPFRVQSSLERLAQSGEVTRHDPITTGPVTWSLPTGTTAA